MDHELFMTLLGVVFGALIAIVIVVAVENLRRPKLELRIAAVPADARYGDGKPAKTGRYVGLNLINKSLPWYARWMARNAALQCRGAISFHHLDGQRIFFADMPVRFGGTPEPVPMLINIGGVSGVLADPIRLTADSRIDVYPGEKAALDVAARFDSDADCYGWSNLSYFSDPPWRHPDWRLPRGRYLIKATVSSSGEKCSEIFRLLNEGSLKDFRLEPALPTDKTQ